MKSVITAALLSLPLALGACSKAPATDSSPTIAANGVTGETKIDTKVVAVLTYADWCGSCKILDPKIKAMQAAMEKQGVEFVKLDYTDKNADDFFAQAEAAGVESAIRTALDGTIKTGRLYLVPVGSDSAVAMIDKTATPMQIKDKMLMALKKAG